MLDREDTYDTIVLRSKLTRNLAAIFEQVNDEIVEALEECIPMSSEGMLSTHKQLMC